MLAERWGSSPLTRGKLDKTARLTRGHGLIPAHAGKTRAGTTAGRCSGAHPRSRGENIGHPPDAHEAAGSSPLTRGKLWVAGAGEPSEGLIPAHAGKTVGRGRGRAERGAHPRSRGENCFIARVSRAFSGSSPLTRGKQGITSQLAANNGLIPAHAGKTGKPTSALPRT